MVIYIKCYSIVTQKCLGRYGLGFARIIILKWAKRSWKDLGKGRY